MCQNGSSMLMLCFYLCFKDTNPSHCNGDIWLSGVCVYFEKKRKEKKRKEKEQKSKFDHIQVDFNVIMVPIFLSYTCDLFLPCSACAPHKICGRKSLK